MTALGYALIVAQVSEPPPPCYWSFDRARWQDAQPGDRFLVRGVARSAGGAARECVGSFELR